MYAPTRDELHQILRIVTSLHEADSAHRIRQQVAHAILELLRADYLASYVRNPSSGHFEDCVAVNIGGGNLTRYEDYFQFHDPITPLLRPSYSTVVASVIAQSALEKTEFFNDFLLPGGLHHGIDLHMYDAARHVGDLRIWRARNGAPFGAREVCLLELLKPHLSHALRQAAALASLRSGDIGAHEQAHDDRAIVLFSAARQPQSDWSDALGLTRREAQVCALIMQGLSDKEISRELAISFPTVRTHLSHTFEKAGVSSRAELIHRISIAAQA